jgi:septal ring factor EnvC (AmiA/AmiB activator)
MALVELVHTQSSQQVSIVPLINKCDLFKNNASLTISPYRVQSAVSLEDFQAFVSALEDKSINIKDRNFPGLSQLSDEFGFQALSMKLSAHRRSLGLSDAQTAEVRSHISALEECAGEHKGQLAALQSALRRVEADLARFASEFEAKISGSRTSPAHTREGSAHYIVADRLGLPAAV